MRAALLALLVAACGGSSMPASHDPADRPPLPPASGTPIGYLIDGAGELHLRDDEVAKLKEIDLSLAGELDAIDTRLRSTNATPPDASAAPPQMRGRGRHGRGGHRRAGGAGSAAAAHGDPAAADRLIEERRADVKEALARAFGVLDADQQPAAKKLLEDHDVDVDDNAPPAPAPGDETPEN